MSATAADVLDRSPYEAPEASLIDNDVLVPDKLFSHEGRVGVLRFNTRLLQSLCVMAVLGAVMFLAMASESDVLMLVTGIPVVIGFIAAAAVMVYASIKRLHDLQFSGWYYLIGIIPIVGTIWTLFYSLKPGKVESNQYGAFREATKGDKVAGVLGIILLLTITVGSFWIS